MITVGSTTATAGQFTSFFVYGNLGDDVIDLGTNQGAVYGGRGNDVIMSNNAFTSAPGALGNDTFIANGAVVANPGGTPVAAGVNAGTGGPSALTITDFVSGSDEVSLGGPVAVPANFPSATVVGGLSQAIQAGQNSGTTYTFVARTADGHLFHNEGNGAPLVGVTLSGDNRANGLVPTDIISFDVAVGDNGDRGAPILTPPPPQAPAAIDDGFFHSGKRTPTTQLQGNVQSGESVDENTFRFDNSADQDPSGGSLPSSEVTQPMFGMMKFFRESSIHEYGKIIRNYLKLFMIIGR